MAVAACVPAYSQDNGGDGLHKEIVVEKEFVPTETKAEKADVLPVALTQDVTRREIPFSDWAIPAVVNPYAVTQSPILYADRVKPSDKRGYAYFGMGNYLNTALGAGYRIVNTGKVDLGVHFMHRGTKGYIEGKHSGWIDKDGTGWSDYAKQFVADERLTADFAYRARRGTLTASASYQYSRFNYYGTMYEVPGDRRQTINRFDAGLLWRNTPSSDNRTTYYAGLSYHYYGNGFGYWQTTAAGGPEWLKGLRENHARLKGGFELTLYDDSYAGIDGDFRLLRYRHAGGFVTRQDGTGDKSFGMFTFRPYYSRRTDRLNLRLGVRIDLSVNNGKAFRIAPDVHLDWKAGRFFTLTADVEGGNRVHTLGELSEYNRYLMPSQRLGNTYTIMDATVGFGFGPFRGFSITPLVGFAFVRDALMPVLYSRMDGGLVPAVRMEAESTTVYGTHDMNGFKAGVKVAYRYGDKAEIEAGYLFMPQGDDSGYVLDYDRARHRAGARLRVTPVDALDLGLGYTLLAGRRLMSETVFSDGAAGESAVVGSEKMPVISDLNFHAAYRFNDMLSAQLDLNNLLNRRHELFYGMFSQKFNFMVGLAVKF